LRREIPLVSGKDFLSKTAPPRVTKSIPTNTQGNTGIIGRIREQVLTREP